MTKVVVTVGAIRRRAKSQSNHHHQQTNTQLFTASPDALTVTQPTVSMSIVHLYSTELFNISAEH